uniref:Uncharacterized protein n=1 Tax=Haptolina ericina TaxID=156174 RepID=A0A7S3EQI6_9EUKA|mmetsp:Transcript_10106/g.23037  ORF Transcript_10106/g.23037 Transcript_10106/m.23037 type:complete len:185 (+) Transcript_10106:459-1013(+)
MMFDVTCMGGFQNYSHTRACGECHPAVLSSVHIRCTDLEMACQSEKGDDPTAFKKNTRAMFGSVMRYLTGIHDAWERRYPDNHDRISRLSVAQLQCTRGDLASLATIPVDYAVPIVALIIDCTHSTKWTVSACMVTTRMHGSCTMFAAVIPSSSSARRVQFRFSWGHGLHDPCMGRNGSRAEAQ